MTRQRRNLILLSSISGLAMIAWIVVLLLPLQNSLKEKDGLLFQERIKGEIASLQEQNVQATEREYKRLQASSKTFESYFISEESVLSFIATLESIAQKTSVHQDIENFLAPTGGAKVTSFNIHLSGSTKSLLQYLTDLETIDQYVAVNSLSFTHAATDSSAAVTLQLSVSINWL